MEPDPSLILTVGLPRSGKSTWAKKQGHPIVNPDSIRLALHGERFLPEAEPMIWMIVRYMIRALFLAGHKTVILDACNTKAKRRDPWMEFCGQYGYIYKIELFKATPQVCIQRALEMKDKEIIPVINRMAKSSDVPFGSF
ncbi:MAG: ATP-binding protein [Planctomycetes bacterium]|nr:ATP-binding protein [Planctomycetota bacterium]